MRKSLNWSDSETEHSLFFKVHPVYNDRNWFSNSVIKVKPVSAAFWVENAYIKKFSITFQTELSTAGFVYCELGYWKRSSAVFLTCFSTCACSHISRHIHSFYIYIQVGLKLSLLCLLRLALGFLPPLDFNNMLTLLLHSLNDQWLCSWHESTWHVREPARVVMVRWMTNCYSIVHLKCSEKGCMVLFTWLCRTL